MDNTQTVNGADQSEKKRGKWATKELEFPFVHFKWSDGATTTVDVTSFPEDDQKYATLWGFSQKLGDSYSQVPSLEVAKAKFDKQLATIREKGFTGRVEGDTEESAELLAQAVHNSFVAAGRPSVLNDVLEKVKAADRKQRNAWKSVDTVAFHLAQLRKHAETPDLAKDFGY